MLSYNDLTDLVRRLTEQNTQLIEENRRLKDRLLDAIYQNPLLIAKHFQQKTYPLAVTGIQGGEPNVFESVLIGACKEGAEHLDFVLLNHLKATADRGYEAEVIYQITHEGGEQIFTRMEHGEVDGKTIPTSFHFPKNYEEHIPLLASISGTEIARRLCVSLLPMALFLLTTAYGLYRNRRMHDKYLVLCVLVAVGPYFCYLTVRSSTHPSLLLYLLIPLLPLPFAYFRFKQELR